MVVAVVVIIFALLSLLALERPSVAIAAAFSVFGFEQWAQANSSFFGAHGSLLNIAVAGLAAVAAVSMFIREQLLVRRIPAAFWCLLALYALTVLSCFWSPTPDKSVELLKDSAPYIVVIVLFTPLLLFGEKQLNDVVVDMFVFASIVTAMIAFGTEIHEHGRAVKLSDAVNKSGDNQSVGSPLMISSLAGHAMIVAFLAGPALLGRFHALRLLVLPIGAWVIVRSGSRGQLIAVLPVMVAFVLLARGIRLREIIKTVVGLGVAAVAVFAAFEFGEFYVFDERWSLDGMKSGFEETRVEMASAVLDKWTRGDVFQLLFGMGNSSSYTFLDMYCHVLPVEILVEEGIFGLLLLTTFFVLTVKSFFSLSIKCWPIESQRLAVASLGAMYVYELVLSMKQASFIGNYYLFLLGILICRANLFVPSRSNTIDRSVPRSGALLAQHIYTGATASRREFPETMMNRCATTESAPTA